MKVIIKYNDQVKTAIFGVQEINVGNDSVAEIKESNFTWYVPLNQGMTIHISER